MILVINIGNSNIRFGLFDKESLLDCKKSWIFASKPHKSEEEYIELFESYYKKNVPKIFTTNEIVIGSVVPFLTKPIADALEKIHHTKPLLVDRNCISPIEHSSNQLGTDLYANAICAYDLYKSSSLVIDFGTALTFTLVNEKGNLIGTLIIPGIKTSLDALIRSTAQLEDIPLERPSHIIGKNTQTAMQSGIIYGFTSMVEGLIEKIKKETHFKNFKIIATGGLSDVYGPLIKKIDLTDKLHTIKGIRLLYEFNKENFQ